ncbi:hypothetical protein Bbelb_166840 [Branchiostoma belcheri]|nr:hypothetical protein Bbelb_166840 [Branchiostoma belcheri]
MPTPTTTTELPHPPSTDLPASWFRAAAPPGDFDWNDMQVCAVCAAVIPAKPGDLNTTFPTEVRYPFTPAGWCEESCVKHRRDMSRVQLGIEPGSRRFMYRTLYHYATRLLG